MAMLETPQGNSQTSRTGVKKMGKLTGEKMTGECSNKLEGKEIILGKKSSSMIIQIKDKNGKVIHSISINGNYTITIESEEICQEKAK